jgi:hypothetical protein
MKTRGYGCVDVFGTNFSTYIWLAKRWPEVVLMYSPPVVGCSRAANASTLVTHSSSLGVPHGEGQFHAAAREASTEVATRRLLNNMMNECE